MVVDEAKPTFEELVADNDKRLKALAPYTIDFTPPRINHLTEQVFKETWATVEEWEYAWQEKVAALLSEVEPDIAKAKIARADKLAATPSGLLLPK